MAIIVLTVDHIDQLKTPAGGYNEKAMTILGVWPLRSGWKERLIGAKIGDRRLKSAIKAASEGKKHFYHGNTRRRH